MNSLQACVVNELEKCPDPTPANIMDSIFNFIKRVTPCENLLGETAANVDPKSNASNMLNTLSAIEILFTIAILNML